MRQCSVGAEVHVGAAKHGAIEEVAAVHDAAGKAIGDGERARGRVRDTWSEAVEEHGQ